MLVQLPLHGYAKIQGSNGETVLGLDRALTRIKDVGSLGKLGVISEAFNSSAQNTERPMGKLKPIAFVFQTPQVNSEDDEKSPREQIQSTV